MEEKIQEVYRAFNGKLVGNDHTKRVICEIVALLPTDLMDSVTEKCWFITSPEDAWAFTMTGQEIANEHLVFINHELWEEEPGQIHYTILHEIGHVVLGHKNAILENQTKAEIDQQEHEADNFAKKYLS